MDQITVTGLLPEMANGLIVIFLLPRYLFPVVGLTGRLVQLPVEEEPKPGLVPTLLRLMGGLTAAK